MQNKAVHLLTAYTLTACWEHGSEHVEGSSFTQFKFRMNPHRNTRNGDNPMTYLECRRK